MRFLAALSAFDVILDETWETFVLAKVSGVNETV